MCTAVQGRAAAGSNAVSFQKPIIMIRELGTLAEDIQVIEYRHILSIAPLATSSLTSFGERPSTWHPTLYAVPSTSLTVPARSFDKDLNRMVRAMAMISSSGIDLECLMFFSFLRSRGGSFKALMTKEEAEGTTETAAWRFWIVNLTVTRRPFCMEVSDSTPPVTRWSAHPVTCGLCYIFSDLFWRQTKGTDLGCKRGGCADFTTSSSECAVASVQVNYAILRQHTKGRLPFIADLRELTFP